VWFHGDAQPGNLLAKNGRLCAVIDFGTCGVSDPACDTTIAWTFLSGHSSRGVRCFPVRLAIRAPGVTARGMVQVLPFQQDADSTGRLRHDGQLHPFSLV
jgi:aminoglycoside phosphotransferase (APT) family kinase protein